jgi:hypothetical protein
MLIATPASAIDHAPSLYAAIVSEAELAAIPDPIGTPRTRCTIE